MLFGAPPIEVFWKSVWFIGTLVFYGRFHLQWYASEVQKRSVVPISFWYMSATGALLLFAYAVYEESPLGTLSTCFNIVVYARNLYHVWGAQGWLTPRRKAAMNACTGAILAVSLALTAYVFWIDYTHASAQPEEHATQIWFWLAVGIAGQILFGGRWAVQWFATERRKESVVPLSFWYISLIASLMLSAAFLADPDPGEKLFALGILTTIPVYIRNIWLVYRHRQAVPAMEEAGPAEG